MSSSIEYEFVWRTFVRKTVEESPQDTILVPIEFSIKARTLEDARQKVISELSFLEEQYVLLKEFFDTHPASGYTPDECSPYWGDDGSEPHTVPYEHTDKLRETFDALSARMKIPVDSEEMYDNAFLVWDALESRASAPVFRENGDSVGMTLSEYISGTVPEMIEVSPKRVRFIFRSPRVAGGGGAGGGSAADSEQ